MTLFILDINKLKEQRKLYIIETLSCVLFAMVYEYFSHGVISYFMVFAFIIPLVLGVISVSIFCLKKVRKMPTRLENNMYNAGVATITIGSIIEGILQIYGTTNVKVDVYFIVGIILLVIAIFSYLLRKKLIIYKVE